VAGEVEVVREEVGKADERLGILSAGTSFGELALLNRAPRTATVRCLTRADVVIFDRTDFEALVGESEMRGLMEKRLHSMRENAK
jgi:CRP/FNR family cyclic AMP-dependent transcriptional regulator